MDPQSLSRTKKDARQALLDLHSQGNDFAKIASRGIEPDLLRALYPYLGVPLPPSPPAQVINATESRFTGSSVPADSDLPQNHGSSPQVNIVKGDNLIQISAATPITDQKHDTKSPVAGEMLTKVSSNYGGKSSSVKGTESKALDRKDYIARMLAARAGKPIATSASSATLVAPTLSAPQVPPKSLSSTTATITELSTDKPAAQEFVSQTSSNATLALSGAQADDKDAEAKKKAQTDLARQKIEELKLRQESRKVVGSASTQNGTQASSESSGQAQAIARIDSPRPITSSRQNSYFSPVNQKAPFSIPGLFMTPETTPAITASKEEPGQASTKLNQKSSEPLSVQQNHDQSSFQTIPPEPDLQKAPAETKSGQENSVLAPSGTLHRKRQKAADFLDSPSTRIKRPLGQQADSDVIIDISDDEMADGSDVDSMDVNNFEDRVSAAKDSGYNSRANRDHKASRDLPPLSDPTLRKKAPTMASPVAPMPKSTEGLKTKEMEIELMNRKIAELEQRISAKKTTSRAQTPGASSRTTVSPPPVLPSQNNAAIPEGTTKSLPETNGDSKDTQSGNVSLSVSEQSETRAAEQKLQEVEEAKAEIERSLAVDKAQASEVKKVPEQLDAGAVEQGQHPKSRADVQRSPDLELPSAGDQHEWHNQQPQAPNGETALSETSLRSQEENEMTPAALEPSLSQNTKEQRKVRRLAIETGLPVLDASVQKTKQKLESLRLEIDALEIELQRGVEGRKALVEELEELSEASKDPSLQLECNLPSSDQPLERPNTPEEGQGEYWSYLSFDKVTEGA